MAAPSISDDPFDDARPACSASPEDVAILHDVVAVRRVLVEAARRGAAMSYSETLARLGLGFSRPRMRTLCRTMDRIDEDGRAAGEPGLAVLVVRAADGLPGQGWWTTRGQALGYEGAWEGPAAQKLVAREQKAAFRYWKER